MTAIDRLSTSLIRVKAMQPRSYPRRLMLLPILLLAFLMRGIPIYNFAYPTGPDYGLYLYYSDLLLRTGTPPPFVPFFQLGTVQWPVLPGGPMIYSILAGLSGASAFDFARITPIFGVIEVAGVFFLARKLFKRDDAALFAALVTAVLPLYVDMMSWAGYMNTIGLALVPYAFLVWLDYWDQPTWQRLVIATLVICGVAYVHHVTTMWIGLTLVGFVVVQMGLNPLATVRKTVPIALAGLIVGLPILLDVLHLFTQQNFAAVLTQAQRFDTTQVTWEAWARIMTPVALVLLIGGMVAFLRLRQIARAGRLLILIFAIVTVVFTFGWVIALKFQYTRAIYFFALPIALGAGALLTIWSNKVGRVIFAGTLATSLAVSGIAIGFVASHYFEIVTPPLLDGVAWLKDNSSPDDVIATGSLYGFQLPRLLERPLLVAMSPDIVSNGDGLQAAADGMAVLKGLQNMDDVLAAYHVRYVIVRNYPPELPDPVRTHAIMEADPNMQLVYENRDVSIYAVKSLD